MDKIIAKSSIIKKVNFENKVFQILEDLRAGKLIIAGLENGYVLVGDPNSEAAIEKAKKLRNLDQSTYFPLLFTSISSLQQYTDELSSAARLLISNYTPGAINLVLQSSSAFPWTLGTTAIQDSFTVRIPKNKLLRAVIDLSGPLFFTPAKTAGGKTPMQVDDLLVKFISGTRHIIDSGKCEANGFATSISFLNAKPVVIREGIIPVYEIRKLVPEILDVLS
jgi:L-threonylcarbamoyladenylate synthase